MAVTPARRFLRGLWGALFAGKPAPKGLECRRPLAGEGLFKIHPGARRLGLVH